MAKIPALTVWGNPDPTGDLELAIELSQDWSAEHVEVAKQHVTDFVAVGGRGGYCIENQDPARSQLRLTGAEQVSGTWLRFPLHAQNVDARSFQLLRHLLSKLDFEPVHVRRVYVQQRGDSTAAGNRIGAVDDDNEEDAYPPAGKLGFKVEDSEEPASKGQRVLVEFDGSPDASHFELLRPLVGSWGKLLEGGAFVPPYGLPDEVDNVMGEVALFDATTAEIEVAIHSSSDESWNVLLNLLEVFSQTTLRIVEVTLA